MDVEIKIIWRSDSKSNFTVMLLVKKQHFLDVTQWNSCCCCKETQVIFIYFFGWVGGGYNSFMEYEFYKISMLHDHTAEPCRHTISPFHFYGFIHTVHLRAVIFGVTFECQPVTRMSSPFFPVTGEERTPRKQDIVGVHFRKKKLSATLYSSLWQSHWADIMCELLAPFKLLLLCSTILHSMVMCNSNDLDMVEHKGHDGFLISNTFYSIIL